MKYYSLTQIKKLGCRYNLIYGERSSGKTHAIQCEGLEKYLKNGEQMAILRRWREDFKGKRGQAYFESLMKDGNGKNKIKIMSGGRFDRIIYNSSRWYLAYWDEDLQKNVCDEKPLTRDLGNTTKRYEVKDFKDVKVEKETPNADGEVNWSLKIDDVCLRFCCKDDYHLRDFLKLTNNA